MAVDWSLQGRGFNAMEALQSFGQAQQQGLQRQQMALAQQQREREAQAQQQAMAARQQASQRLAVGDAQGAAQTAAAGGDFDYARFAATASEVGHKQAMQQIDELGQLALLADTPEKWDAYATQYVQQGHPEAARFIGKYSPETRAAIIAQAGKAKEFLDQQSVDYKVIPPGGYLQGFDSRGIPLGGAQTTPPVEQMAPQQGVATSSDLMAKAQAAIAAGADPAAVMARLQQMQGGAPSQGGATFP